jgi:hypothetical protein
MTEHKNIYAALAAAQAGMGTVVKGAVNPAFKSKYADLADVVAVVVPALSANGIAMYHSMIRDDHGLIMRTTLSHGATDTHIHCDVPLIVDRNNMQGMKSATTYAKRIGVESLTGIAPEDDDGNAAAKSPPVIAEPVRAPNINADQFIELSDLIEQTGSDPAKLAQWLGAKTLEELKVPQWERAMAQLRKKAAQMMEAQDVAAQ